MDKFSVDSFFKNLRNVTFAPTKTNSNTISEIWDDNKWSNMIKSMKEENHIMRKNLNDIAVRGIRQ